MPQPWIHDGTEQVQPPSVQVNNGAVAPLKIENFLDFKNIDTHQYSRDTRRQFENRTVNESAKCYTEELNKFCDENAQALNQDSEAVPSEYGVDKHVQSALIDSKMRHNFKEMKIEILNAVQQKAIKVIRDGEGIMVEAPTGIGKTYAFLIPVVENAIMTRSQNKAANTGKPSPSVLVIAPTGNLVRQLFSRCELFLGLKDRDNMKPVHDIKIDLLVADYRFNAEECDIAFCTMGKLKATIEDKQLCLDNLKTIVLDEADKMIDSLAFGRDIDWVLEQLKPEVMANLQSCFFSATFQRDFSASITLNSLQMKMFGENPWKLVHCPKMPGYITQRVVKLDIGRNDFRSPWLTKMNAIRDLIDKDLEETGCKKEGPYKETITIFCETVGRVAQVATALRLLGYNFKPVCRTVTKKQQQISISELELKQIQGIVCTNVLARGIDVSSVKHTIIMEMSNDFDTYRHRIGRVGRDGTGGKSTVLVEQTQLMNGQFCNLLENLYQYMEESERDDWLKEWYEQRKRDSCQ